MGLFGGKEEEPEETLVQKVTSQVADYLFSLVVPVGILLYVAPQKSLSYIVDNAKEQVSSITEFDFEVAWNATKDLAGKTLPLLQMEGEAISHAAEQVPGYVSTVYNSEWLNLLQEYWQYAAGVVVLLAIVLSLFPWGKLIDWVAQSAWRTVMLFVGVLPLDDGLDSISDNESGTYDIVLVGGSILLTLAINYGALLATCWLIKKALLFIFAGIVSLAKRLLAKQVSWAWTAIKIGFGKVFGRKKVETKEE
eukprot:Phypoly_transcript_15822.p1 GENE.Phypoly_transcript_15822~~Phypoly_transcript_15822.p1  ORF type:complete len:251 (+),score=45.78 Phypoly_transcript_15822:106-858(+)